MIPSSACQPWHADQPGQCRKRSEAKPQLHHATGHDRRRTFITTFAHKGVNVRVLAELAGHRSIATTQRYIELNENVLRAAVELL